jgi:hypothetical protein
VAAGDQITRDCQVEWRGVLWGEGTSVGLADLPGWLDAPDLRVQSTGRPDRHGVYAGRSLAGARVVEVLLTAVSDDLTLVDGIRAATAIAEDPTEEELVVWFGTGAAQLVYARLVRRALPTDLDWVTGVRRCRLQFMAPDPRRYSVTEYSASIGLPPTPSGGLAFPLAFPLDFGATTSVGQLTVTNGGDATTWPTLQIQGPVTGPIVTNVGTGDQLVFDPTWTVAAGETVEVDTDARSVTLAGVSRRDRLHRAGWFGLAPGDTNLTFTSVGAYDAAAELTVLWRDASI